MPLGRKPGESVIVGQAVGVGVGVGVAVAVAVGVAVDVDVGLGDAVGVGVGVGAPEMLVHAENSDVSIGLPPASSLVAVAVTKV